MLVRHLELATVTASKTFYWAHALVIARVRGLYVIILALALRLDAHIALALMQYTIAIVCCMMRYNYIHTGIVASACLVSEPDSLWVWDSGTETSACHNSIPLNL